MKTNKKENKATETKFVPISEVLKPETVIDQGRGRMSRFAFQEIKPGFGLYCGKGSEVSKISPLVSYFNKTKDAHLKCKTVLHGKDKQVFVYNPKAEKNGKEMAAA